MSIFPTKILLATDGSEEAELALRTAADLAKSTSSELHVAYVFPEDVGMPYTTRPVEVLQQELGEAMKQAQGFLDRQAERIEAEGADVAETYLRRGRPDREVVLLSEELEIGLIVMGSRGFGGVRRALMGSVSDYVARHAHCPVMIVREAASDRSELDTG